jgi:hypothetical protein
VLRLETEVESFFRGLVQERLDEPVLGYVVSILVDYTTQPLSREPLCLRLGDLSVRRVVVLKEVGDEALLVSGFLRGPDPRYYAQIGATAYGELSTRIRDPLFRIMAHGFPGIQRALGDVRRELELQGTDYQALIREAHLGDSEKAWKRLESLGLVLPS